MSEQSKTGELDARAATQRGQTGDKIPGFDPAMAPMETDAEAGGAAFGGAATRPAAEAGRPPESGTGSAMRPMAAVEPRAGGRGWWLPVAALMAVAILVLASIALA
ncbi:hypothetical protein EJC49_21700 [Aquibium carbonis]|uniref:Uncharacterized protein n=1 Tax=Aquibium carbonis TaxID=2495581 RepID=A0A429YQY1_9HYPH|nr:hypothetical protein [Aquibium carbonis]RST83877.1 hypothetical protein EJC49_21700 [Aquibium carbonis]